MGHGFYVMQNYRNKNPDYDDRRHAGIDISWHNDQEASQAAGMTVYASAVGTVKCVDRKITWPGQIMVIEHRLPNDRLVYSVYGHLDELFVAEGEEVQRGEPVGSILNQGDLSHLHFEVRKFPYWSDKRQFGGTDTPVYDRPPTESNDVICAGRGYAPLNEDTNKFGWLDPAKIYYTHRPPYPRTVVTSPQKSIPVFANAGSSSPTLGTLPRASRIRASRGFSRKAKDPNCYLPIPDRWYVVDFQGGRGYIQGFVCKGWRSELNVGESTSLGADWQEPASKPLIHYRFDEPDLFETGMVLNWGLLGERRNGIVTGTANLRPWFTVPPGGNNYAIELDGDTGYVEVNEGESIAFPRQLTVEALVWRANNEGEDAIAGKWYGGEDQWLLTIYPDGYGKLVFSVRLKDGTYVSAEYLIPDSGYLESWNQIAASYDVLGRLRLYWNGILVAENRAPANRVKLADSSGLMHVGSAGVGANWSRFRGRLDEIKIWRVAR
jgi:murein DD-endopeptidase MepM/ murein hydrolase activator NlpD